MIEAIRELKEANGGLVVVTKQQNMVLPLQFAGIMSVKRYEDVILDFRKLKKTLDILQSQLSDPFMALAFIALPVIPHLKLTDQGLVDVDKFEFTNVLV